MSIKKRLFHKNPFAKYQRKRLQDIHSEFMKELNGLDAERRTKIKEYTDKIDAKKTEAIKESIKRSFHG